MAGRQSGQLPTQVIGRIEGAARQLQLPALPLAHPALASYLRLGQIFV